MFTIDKYILAESLDQAYELNQSRRNAIIGGMLWLKMGRKKIGTAIDLSSLGLNLIEEDDENFRIGSMCTLRQLELHEGLNSNFNNLFSDALGHIVGVQMRNLATVGGSIFSRFGFSDLLTALMSLDCSVELFKKGIVSLEEYAIMPYDKDIVVRIIIKKDGRKTSCMSQRMSSSDFPVLVCAVSKNGNFWKASMGGRPGKAVLKTFELGDNPSAEEIDKAVSKAVSETPFGSNMRGSSRYRQLLAHVLIKRNIGSIIRGGQHAD
ncbi:MAG: FAD binding domain-containing protein [Sedimentibacter sp.]|uniref:FAD binding domain-containing protein n=1 Tax=Sedimentibacter sp. TaxID=1960295 RepID=UPI0031595FD4